MTRRLRPPLVPRSNRWLLAALLPMIALMFHQSGAWWVVGVVGSLVAIRLVLWALAGYSSMASRAVEDRDYDPADLVSPYFRIPIIGWMMRLGAWMAGIRSKSQDDEAKRT